MSLLDEFKTFALRGNVVDLAVGVVVGTAFSKIVSSLVENIITPPLGALTGGVDFKNLALTVLPAMGDHPAVVVGYGKFLQSCFDFLIIAGCIFMVVKGLSRLMPPPPRPQNAAEPQRPPQEQLLVEIRDLLKQQAKKK